MFTEEKRAIFELRKNAGTQFDADIVNIFIEKVLNTSLISVKVFEDPQWEKQYLIRS